MIQHLRQDWDWLGSSQRGEWTRALGEFHLNRQLGGYPLYLRRERGVGLIAAGLVFASLASTVLAAEPDRLVHRFLAIALSPDGSAVASVEGDVPVSGSEPTVRDLVIRSSDGRTSVTVALPCGRVAECLPSSPLWSPDSKRLTFAIKPRACNWRGIPKPRRCSIATTLGRPTVDLSHSEPSQRAAC
jgi:hypothetical protein